MAKISLSSFLLSEDLKKFQNTSPEQHVRWEDVRSASKKHPVKFPKETARLDHLLRDAGPTSFKDKMMIKHNIVFDKDKVEEYINSTYPIIHEDLMPLLAAFIEYKKYSGTRTERDYYRDTTIYDLVDKLLNKRPIAFLTSSDSYLLPGGKHGTGGFEAIGEEKERELKLSEYNSYDEMRLAALVGVSSISPFINKGDRYNRGEPGNGRDHELEGVIVGQVGARFEKRDLMEWQDCAVYPEQNAQVNGYGKNGKGLRSNILKAWAHLWGEDYLPTYEEVHANQADYEILRRDTYLNKRVYKARMRMLAEVLLIEASSRAKAAQKKAYIHVVGLGLGVWQIASSQQQLYVEAWVEAIDKMDDSITKYISTIDFSWIDEQPVQLSETDIKVIFSKRNLHDTVPEDCLLVCNYAWDSNSTPGNEYWMGSLTASGDPAAACSSSIAELQNARINPRVSAQYLRLASPKYGIVSVQRYLELISPTRPGGTGDHGTDDAGALAMGTSDENKRPNQTEKLQGNEEPKLGDNEGAKQVNPDADQMDIGNDDKQKIEEATQKDIDEGAKSEIRETNQNDLRKGIQPESEEANHANEGSEKPADGVQTPKKPRTAGTEQTKETN